MTYRKHFTTQQAEVSAMSKESLQDFAADAGAPEKPAARGPQQIQLAVRGHRHPPPAKGPVPLGDGGDRGAEDLVDHEADAAEVTHELVPDGAGPGRIGSDDVEVVGVG